MHHFVREKDEEGEVKPLSSMAVLAPIPVPSATQGEGSGDAIVMAAGR